MNTNPYLYAKYLFNNGKQNESIRFLNNWFQTHFGTVPFGKFEEYSAISSVYIDEFRMALKILLTPDNNRYSIYLRRPYGEVFRRLWKRFPNYELLFVCLDGDFSLPTYSQRYSLSEKDHADTQNEIGDIQSMQTIVETLSESMEEGWIVPVLPGKEANHLAEPYAGRMRLSFERLEKKFDDKKLKGMLSQLKERSLFIPRVEPADFWQQMTSDSLPGEKFLQIVFGHDRINRKRQENNFLATSAHPEFYRAAMKSFRTIRESSDYSMIQFMPAYAGLSVPDSWDWLSRLIAVMERKKPFSSLF